MLSILNLIDPVTGSLLSAGIGALGGVFGSLFGKKSQDDTNKASMELAEYQYSKNLEMWNRQNAYNTPSNQVKRIKAAGLNPALLYGSGSVANTASDAPKYEAPKLRAYTNFGDLGASYLSQIPLQVAQVRNLDANSALTDQKTKTEIQETGLRLLQKQIAIIDRSIKAAQERNAWTDVKYYERQKKLALQQMMSTIGYTAAQTVTELVKPSLLRSQRENYKASTANTKEQTETVKALRPGQVAKLEAERSELVSRTAKNYASAAESRAHITYYNALSEYTKYQTKELSYRQEERLDNAIAKLSVEVETGRIKKDRESIQYEFDKILKENGVDPRESGVIGAVQKIAYGFEGIVAKNPELFRRVMPLLQVLDLLK